MRNKDCAAFLGAVVALGGALVLFGWIAGIEALIRPADNLARVKPITALSFIIAGIQLVLMSYRYSERSRAATFLLTFAALWLLFIMGSQLLTALNHTPSGIELIMPERDDPTFTPSNRPASIGTICLFFTIAVCGLLDNLGDKLYLRQAINAAALLVPFSAICGYALDVPALYYFVENVSTRMAFYTAILGLIGGISIYFSTEIKPAQEA